MPAACAVVSTAVPVNRSRTTLWSQRQLDDLGDVGGDRGQRRGVGQPAQRPRRRG